MAAARAPHAQVPHVRMMREVVELPQRLVAIYNRIVQVFSNPTCCRISLFSCLTCGEEPQKHAAQKRAHAEYRCLFIGNRRKIQDPLRAGLELQLERFDLSLNVFRCRRQCGRISAAWPYLAQLQLQHHAVIQLRRRLLRHCTAQTAQLR